MSTKSVVQKLQDCDLIRLFLEFVQYHHLQYQKTSKEISYKCYEATWILINYKANGYGRTQSQAYKHALRNLLQILIEEPMYTEFFIDSLATIQNNNNRPSLKKQSVSQPANNYSKKIISSKTQGHEPIENQTKPKEQIQSRLYESYSKANQRSQSKFVPKDWEKPSIKMVESTSVYQTSQLENQKKFSENTNGHLSHGYNTKMDRQSNGPTSEQLRKAMKKLSELEDYLSGITKENQMMKRKLRDLNESETKEEKEHIHFCTEAAEYVQKIDVLDDAQFSAFTKNKPMIPKLKLQILPNYHKKAEKSLNDSLMAAYNEKRQQSVKKLVC